jgi:hypothetical protein
MGGVGCAAAETGHRLHELRGWARAAHGAAPHPAGGNVHLSPEAATYFAKKGCEVLLQFTPVAIHVFNRSHAKKIELFHLTC